MRVLFFSILIFLALAFWWICFPRAEKKAFPVETPSVTLVAPKSAAIRKKDTPFTPAPPAIPGEKLEGNQIRFHVEAGIAIAFGDLLLGAPEDPQLREGIYEAPMPQLWERGEIPYAIADNLPHPERVEKAIQYFKEHTSATFVPYRGQPDVLVFEPGTQHCYSLLGKKGGAQPIRLSPECSWREISHEILHALGFVHEQSRTDRDRYLEIRWENIDPKFQDQFAMVPESFMDAVAGSSFDFHSAMMYRPETFASAVGLMTMVPRGSFQIEPTADGLSEGDIQRVNRLYPR